MRYRTTLGSYAVILGLGPAGVAWLLPNTWLSGWWPLVAVEVVLLCVVGWILLGTRYVVGQDVLDVRVGPLRKRIRLKDITAVHRHRMSNGPMFGLGSDFIGIEYGERAVNISPKDVDGFIQAVRQGSGPAQFRQGGSSRAFLSDSQ